MTDFLHSSLAQAILMLAVLAVLVMIGYYIVRRFRDRADENQLTAHDALTNFREMRQRGDISEAEYRTIKTVLATKLQDELSDPPGDASQSRAR